MGTRKDGSIAIKPKSALRWNDSLKGEKTLRSAFVTGEGEKKKVRYKQRGLSELAAKAVMRLLRIKIRLKLYRTKVGTGSDV